MLTPIRQSRPGIAREGIVRELRPIPKRTEPDDASLVDDVRTGSTVAAGVLFDRHGARIERLIWSLLGPEPEAEDLLHEVFDILIRSNLILMALNLLPIEPLDGATAWRVFRRFR